MRKTKLDRAVELADKLGANPTYHLSAELEQMTMKGLALLEKAIEEAMVQARRAEIRVASSSNTSNHESVGMGRPGTEISLPPQAALAKITAEWGVVIFPHQDGRRVGLDIVPLAGDSLYDVGREREHTLTPMFLVEPPTWWERLFGVTHEEKVINALDACRKWVIGGEEGYTEAEKTVNRIIGKTGAMRGG